LSDSGWDNPNGSFYSSAEDLANLLSFFFRDQQISNSTTQLLDGATLREMMLPRHISYDRKSGFASPFELYYDGEISYVTKRGDVLGYSSEIMMNTATKVGVIVLTDLMEQAAPFAQTIADIIYPTIASALKTLQPPVATPSYWNLLLGKYSSSGTGSFEITGDSNALFYLPGSAGGDPALLQWNIVNATFQLLPSPGLQYSCFYIQIEQFFYNWAIFSFANGNSQPATSVIIPGYFGPTTVFERVSETEKLDNSIKLNPPRFL